MFGLPATKKILMNFNDHLPPHFHAWYNEYKIMVGVA